jgi:hypothetical protein
MTTTTPTTTLTRTLNFISLNALQTQLAEAREAMNQAVRAACRTTVEDGYSLEQFQAASRQADEAQAHYLNLWQAVDELKARALGNNPASPRPYRLTEETSEFAGVWEMETPDGVINLDMTSDNETEIPY